MSGSPASADLSAKEGNCGLCPQELRIMDSFTNDVLRPLVKSGTVDFSAQAYYLEKAKNVYLCHISCVDCHWLARVLIMHMPKVKNQWQNRFDPVLFPCLSFWPLPLFSSCIEKKESFYDCEISKRIFSCIWIGRSTSKKRSRMKETAALHLGWDS